MQSIEYAMGIDSLTRAKTTHEVAEIWDAMGESKRGKHLIISLDNYDKDVYPETLKTILNEENDFIPYFENGKLFFLDDNLINEMEENSPYNVDIPIDYSVMLDTNYASYIQKFVKKQWSSLNNSIFKCIDSLLRYEFNYDYMFYLIENYYNVYLNRNIVTENAHQNQIDMYDNLMCLELFKNIDKKEYARTGDIKYLITEEEANLKAHRIFNEHYSKIDKSVYLSQFLDMHSDLVLFIIGILQIKYRGKSTAERRTKDLFKYMMDVIGIYMEREMIVAHKYFVKQNNLSMLSSVNRNMTREQVYEKIENFAWDFGAPRVMGSYFTGGSTLNYFMPFFLSHDKRLQQLIRLFDVKGIVYDRSKLTATPFGNISGTDYFDQNGINDNFEEYFTSENKANREKIASSNRMNNYSRIQVEFEKLLGILGID